MHIHGGSPTSPIPRSRSSHVPCVVADNRNVPALGRIGDPDDIIASVRVERGEVGRSAGVSFRLGELLMRDAPIFLR